MPHRMQRDKSTFATTSAGSRKAVKLEFKPEDFSYDGNGNGMILINWQDAADKANARLQQMLQDAPRVYGFIPFLGNTRLWSEMKGNEDAHTALLVQIEEMGK